MISVKLSQYDQVSRGGFWAITNYLNFLGGFDGGESGDPALPIVNLLWNQSDGYKDFTDLVPFPHGSDGETEAPTGRAVSKLPMSRWQSGLLILFPTTSAQLLSGGCWQPAY